jgi:hypothetical protein
MSDNATFMNILNALDEEEKLKIIGLTRVQMIEVKPGRVIPRKILKIRRFNAQNNSA